VRALRVTAERVLGARAEAKQLEAELRTLIRAVAPTYSPSPGWGRSAPRRC
jgi:hypothetical protein